MESTHAAHKTTRLCFDTRSTSSAAADGCRVRTPVRRAVREEEKGRRGKEAKKRRRRRRRRERKNYENESTYMHIVLHTYTPHIHTHNGECAGRRPPEGSATHGS
eukprot:TRINITY_DN8615_c0_g1_i2.p3 TRINITY_DN8615_c0_g1~~TRINITY_DN8615_c0_g1_i2.p3  ORF type:complete len:105 (+),score=13.32 TRINITY_DN8615_c0_g1_i2:265-579(+)